MKVTLMLCNLLVLVWYDRLSYHLPKLLRLRLKHVWWYNRVQVCFQNLTPPVLVDLYQSAVRSVNICWYDAMELSPLNWSAVWTRWDLLHVLFWSKSYASAIAITLGPTCNFSFDLWSHTYLLAGSCVFLVYSNGGTEATIKQ